MERRRLEDRAPGVLLASLAEGQPAVASEAFRTISLQRERAEALWAREERAPLLVVEGEDGMLLFVAGGELWRLPRPADTPLDEVAESMAEAVRRHQAATLQKQRFHDGFLVFVERLNRARSRRDVYDALLEQTPQLMGVYAAVLFVALPGAPNQDLHAVSDARVPVEFGTVPMAAVFPRPVPALISHADVLPGQPFAGMAPLFDELRARQLTCMSLGEHGLLVLVERRLGHDFSGEEWFRLQTLGHHAQRCLERLDLSTGSHNSAATVLSH